MELKFLGAAREVTGSCYLVRVGNRNVLVDCGMVQGPDIYNDQSLPIPASKIDAVLLTHAHIDHSGKLPLLYKNGYRNRIYMTRATRDLCKIMLMDSAHIQEQEAKWRNKKLKRGSSAFAYTPLYKADDAAHTIDLIRAVDYLKPITVTDGVTARFIDAGHLLGSSYIELTLTEDDVTRVVLFSGDIGNSRKPIIRDPSVVTRADYVVMESTYGDRNHGDAPPYAEQLATIIEETFAKGGNVVIPTFAVGRMQEMLYFLREIKLRKLCPNFPSFPVYVDSPMAIEATSVYSKNLAEYCNEDTRNLIEKDINPIGFRDLRLSVTSEESQLINANTAPKVILSASGMCEAGRIRHHLKHNLWREECTIVFVGYQVEGTLGRLLLDGAKAVNLFNEPVKVKARIVELEGTSSHADKSALMSWAHNFVPEPIRVFVTHGEDSVASEFADILFREYRLRAIAPFTGATYDLISDECIEQGNPEKKPFKPKAKTRKVSPAYGALEEALEDLKLAVAEAFGYSNHDLRDATKGIRKIIDKLKKE